jgi:hypothetical protein
LRASGEPSAEFCSSEVGVACIQALAQCAGKEAKTEAKIRILESIEKPPSDAEEGAGSSKGLPRYKLVSRPGQEWRSRYLSSENVIEINSAHRDYLAARERLASLKRYIAKLYAKEIVLLNFPQASPPAAMERLIELIQRAEQEL